MHLVILLNEVEQIIYGMILCGTKILLPRNCVKLKEAESCSIFIEADIYEHIHIYIFFLHNQVRRI